MNFNARKIASRALSAVAAVLAVLAISAPISVILLAGDFALLKYWPDSSDPANDVVAWRLMFLAPILVAVSFAIGIVAYLELRKKLSN